MRNPPAVYNEIDPFCCDVLRARIADGSLPPGDVDDRDIREVSADDYKGYGQIHLFAGIGGFGYAARLAGLPDGFGVVTGGFPCQDFSVCGQRAGLEGEHSGLWVELARMVRGIRPDWVVLENTPSLLVHGMGRVVGDLADAGYDSEWAGIPAAAIGAPHYRARQWVVAYPVGKRGGAQESAFLTGWGFSRVCDWRSPEPQLDRVADGVSNRVDRHRSLGNAIDPRVAAEIMRNIKECYGEGCA